MWRQIVTRVLATRDVLPAIVAVAFLARAFVAIASPHVIWPDEQFQVLEPANHVVNGFGTYTWEWDIGGRNWLLPGMQIPILYALRLFGVRGGPVAVDACRLFVAAVNAGALLQFARLLRLRGVSPILVVLAVAPLLFLPRMLAWGAATLSDTWAMSVLWAGLTPAVRALEDPRPRTRAYFVIGLWLAALFGLRVVMAFWIGPFAVGAALLYPRRLRVGAGIFAGLVTGVGLLGALDWITWGTFLSSPFALYHADITEGIAASMGSPPWTFYLASLRDDFGRFALPAGLGVLAIALITRSLRLRRMDALILLPTTAYVVAHGIIRHKEARYLLVAYPALFYCAGIGASALLRRAPRLARLGAAATRSWPPLVAAAILASIAAWYHLPFDGIYTPWGASDATFVAYRHGLVRRNPGSCVLSVAEGVPIDLYSRGQMGFGAPTTFRNVETTQLSREDLMTCRYAMVKGSEREAFERAALPAGWRWLFTGVADIRLYYRDDVSTASP